MWEKLVYGAIGLIIGGIGGSVIASKKTADAVKERLDILEAQNKSLRDEIRKNKEASDKEREEAIERESAQAKELEAYQKLANQYVGDDDDDEDEEDEEEDDMDDDLSPMNTVRDRSDKIHRIDEQTYMADVDYKRHERMIYYQQDSTLVNEENDIVVIPRNILGNEIMDVIDDTSNDSLYAYDEEIDKLYEIHVEQDLGYLKDVLGM